MSSLAGQHTADDGRARCQRGAGLRVMPRHITWWGNGAETGRTRRAEQNVNTSKFQNNVREGTWSQCIIFSEPLFIQETHMFFFSNTSQSDRSSQSHLHSAAKVLCWINICTAAATARVWSQCLRLKLKHIQDCHKIWKDCRVSDAFLILQGFRYFIHQLRLSVDFFFVRIYEMSNYRFLFKLILYITYRINN